MGDNKHWPFVTPRTSLPYRALTFGTMGPLTNRFATVIKRATSLVAARRVKSQYSGASNVDLTDTGATLKKPMVKPMVTVKHR